MPCVCCELATAVRGCYNRDIPQKEMSSYLASQGKAIVDTGVSIARYPTRDLTRHCFAATHNAIIRKYGRPDAGKCCADAFDRWCDMLVHRVRKQSKRRLVVRPRHLDDYEVY